MPSLTVSEYVPDIFGVALVLAPEEAESPTPDQTNEVAPPDGFASRVTVPPSHMYPLLVGLATGLRFTVTLVV